MRNLTHAASLVLAAAALAACADQPTTPAARAGGPSLAAAATCAASPTAVATTEAGLRAAVAAAQPGDVIAIRGTIELAQSVVLPTPGVTLTCAEPGAGLALGEGNTGVLLELEAGQITVSGLRLDAEYAFGALVAFNVFQQDFSGIRVIGNDVVCGYTLCVFFVGTRGTQVTDNRFAGDSTNTGIQFQSPGRLADGTPISPVDDVVIARNVIETDDSYPAGIYGAIRVRDGSNATITHNQVGAGWTNGIALTNVYDSRVDHNRIDGALYYGIDVPQIVARPIALRGVSFTGNHITNSGRSAIWPARACYNVFTGNNVQDNDRGAIFLASTGGNVWRGNPGEVEDRGAFDCDGDGDIDPNQISGARASTSSAPAFSVSAVPAQSASSGRYPALQ
jgi:nitrous oxidase accessory protein NosD